MWSISFNYATNDNNCIYIAIFHHLISAEGKFETSGYGFYQNIFIFGANQMMENCDIDTIIAIGCVIKGDTPHFDYVCSGVTQGVTELNLMYDIPFIFGLLTTDTMEQSEDRAGGKHGNKGDEAAITAIKMIDFSCKLQN
jgi:6,7-dimethyl-8-ribityllumazine synthase